MALGYTTFTTEIQAQLGKQAADTTITTARCGRWLNQSIRDIVYATPGLRDVHRMDRDTLKCQEDVYEIDLAQFVTYPVAHVIKLRYLDTTNKNYHQIEPFVGGTDQWDARYPYIPDLTGGIPREYVKRGNKLEIAPAPGSAQANKPIWIEYTHLPPDISGSTTAALTDFDEALLALSVAYGLRTLGKQFSQEAREHRAYAWELVQERVAGEIEFDEIDQAAYNGP